MNWERNLVDATANAAAVRDRFHEWVLSLPWVLERPRTPGAPRVRTFAIDCGPLGVRQLWLVTGMQAGNGVGVIVPRTVATEYERSRRGRVLVPMPARHVLMVLREDVDSIDVGRVILSTYGALLS